MLPGTLHASLSNGLALVAFEKLNWPATFLFSMRANELFVGFIHYAYVWYTSHTDERLTAEEMDEQRIQNVAYQYLCRLEEAKRYVKPFDRN